MGNPRPPDVGSHTTLTVCRAEAASERGRKLSSESVNGAPCQAEGRTKLLQIPPYTNSSRTGVLIVKAAFVL